MAVEQYVVCEIHGERYCIKTSEVKEIKRMKEISVHELPNVPSYIDGIINLRGDVVPIINLREKFEIESKAYDKETRIVIASVEDVLIGMLVDRTIGIVEIGDLSIVEIVEEAKVDTEFISGVGKIENTVLFIFNLQKLIERRN